MASTGRDALVALYPATSGANWNERGNLDKYSEISQWYRITVNDQAATDRDALVALYHATSGINWNKRDNWDTDAELSQWYGVTVNGQGRVVKLSLYGNNLQGTVI